MTIYDQDFVAEETLQQEYQQSGVTDSVAENQEPISEQPVDHEGQAPEMIEEATEEAVEAEQPVANDKDYNFKAMREEIAKIKAEKEALAENLESWKRELAINNVRRQPEDAPRKSAFEEVPDGDLITGAQVKMLLAEKDAEYKRAQQDLIVFNQEQQFKQKYSDYDEVATKYGVPLLKQEPDLAKAFVAAENKPAFLYKLGKMQQLSEAPPPVPTSAPRQEVNKAQRILENSRKPGTLSSATQGQQAISKADYFASMPEADFNALVAKNLEQV